MGRLEGRVAVVTGASKGIGAGIAKELAIQGASVVVNYSASKESAESVAAGITKAGGKAIVVGASIAKSEDIDNLFEEVKKAYGKLDILVNNAGLYAFTPIETLTRESIESMFNVNVTGLLLACKAALPLFPAEGGSIINISSVAGEMAPAHASIYSGTKGAVNSITRVFARELAPKKIRVNAVNPGPIATESFNAAGLKASGVEHYLVQNTPLGRVGQPDDVALVVAFLASEEARWITGSLIDAAGGWR
jgi:3-oxoacyl-[acyl-carrier protein] reductase